MNQEEIDDLKRSLSDFQSERANINLRRIFIVYLQSEHENLPIDFAEVLIDLEQIFNILDIFASWNNPKPLVAE